MKIDLTEHIKSLEDKEFRRQKELEWKKREADVAPLRNATDFKLCVEDWNFVDKVGYPADGEWCFIITPSQHGCLYHWDIGGYSAKQKTFYVNYGQGGLVTKREYVIAWKSFTDFQAEENGKPPQFLTVKNIEGKKV